MKLSNLSLDPKIGMTDYAVIDMVNEYFAGYSQGVLNILIRQLTKEY